MRFDWITKGLESGPNPCWDVDLLSHPDFAVVPTKGSLVPGWVLAVPRFPILSIVSLERYQRVVLIQLLSQIREYLRNAGKTVFYFEHGAMHYGSALACGVDQAHVHVLPLDDDLIDISIRCGKTFTWNEVASEDPWESESSSRDYYLISDFSRAVLCSPPEAESQFFRKAVATSIGRSEQWNYRRFRNPDNARATQDIFRPSTHAR